MTWPLFLLAGLQLLTAAAVVVSSLSSRRRDRDTHERLDRIEGRTAALEDRQGEWRDITNGQG